MALVGLQVEQFRCLEKVELSLDPRYNLFVGPNASGKTSLLEALFFLGRGRSFRSRRLERMIRQGQPEFRIVGRVQEDARTVVLGVRGTRTGTEIRVGGQAADSAADLAGHFPPQVIDPEIHKLLEEGPSRRRRFLDWGVFHVEPRFMAVWQRYHRALRQRNAAFRTGKDPALATVWDAELAQAGEALADLRARYVELLAPDLASIGRRLLGLDVTLGYHRGWPAEETLAEALKRGIDRDQRYAMTQSGPHRADVIVRVEGVAAKERVSRGQQKLLASALTLAQLGLQDRMSPGKSALLLDDPAAELDGPNLEKLLEVVRDLPAQLFVTSLRPDLPGLGAPGSVFHVERGTIRSAQGGG
jgi:DNA replication and repair protein RecF